jgi:hypothetical protein
VGEWVTFFDPAVRGSDAFIAAGMPAETEGIDELRSGAEEWQEPFDEYREEILKLVDLGDELVLAEVQFHDIGQMSGATFEPTQVDLYRVRQSRNTVYRAGYRSTKEALEAVGLSE